MTIIPISNNVEGDTWHCTLWCHPAQHPAGWARLALSGRLLAG